MVVQKKDRKILAASKAPAAACERVEHARESVGRERAVTRRIHVSRLQPGLAQELQLHAPGGRLRVAIYSEFFPVAYRRPDGTYAGLDVDIVEGFCRRAGLRPQWVRTRDFFDTWDAPGVWAKRIDLAIGGIGRGAGRESPGVEWSVPYFGVRRTVVFNKADPIRRFPADVTGVVAGTMGTTGMNDARDRLRRKFGKQLWDHLDVRWNSPDAKDVRDLLDGKIQGLMRGSFVGKAIVAQHPQQLGMAGPWDASRGSVGAFGGEVFAFPCRRGSGLAAQLTAHLLHLSQSGELAALVDAHGMA
jgi:ABC-type amino acid transport substrate-binding protein